MESCSIQLKEETDETQYSLWISETLKLSAEVKLKDEVEINIGGGGGNDYFMY